MGFAMSVIRASICSVTFMVPISAAMDEPTLPGEEEGREDRAELPEDRDGDGASDEDGRARHEGVHGRGPIWSAMTMPVKKRVIVVTGRDW